MKPYLELTKPRITWLILMSTGVGFYFGIPTSGWSWAVLLHCMLGTGLIASGTAALNQWWEQEPDGRMQRTSGRPLPSKRITSANALWFGTALSIVGFADLWYGCNLLTAALGAFTLGSYLFVYTPLKSRTPHSTTVGAIPGAMPPVIGFAAAANALNAEAWILFGILFLWQFPHFYSIAWMYRDDYSKASIRMLPVVDPSGIRTARQMLLYSLALVPVSLLPRYFGMAGNAYFVGALLLGAAYVYFSAQIAWNLTRQGARKVLLASIVYLPLLYTLLVANRPAL